VNLWPGAAALRSPLLVVAAAVGLAAGVSQMREVAGSVCEGGSAAGFCEGEALCSQRKMSGVCSQLKADWPVGRLPLEGWSMEMGETVRLRGEVGEGCLLWFRWVFR